MSMNRREFGERLAGAAAALAVPSTARAWEETAAKPLDFVPGSFTIVALPDTQIYCEQFPKHFHNQAEWIVANREKHNIRFVTHLGDITNRNTKEQWAVARAAMQKLDGLVPYSLVLGNHDCGSGGEAGDRTTMLNDYFSIADARKGKTLAGLMEDKRLDNSFHVFEAAGAAYLVLALEWGPRDEVVQWAREVLRDHQDHRAILTTHAYLYFDDARYDWKKFGGKQSWNPHAYKTARLPGGTNDGEELWTKLLADHPAAFLTLNGHVLGDGLGRLTSNRSTGKPVHQVLVNYQMKPQGGEGYLRLVEFLPDGKTIQCRSYSPSLDRFKTDAQNQFVLTLG